MTAGRLEAVSSKQVLLPAGADYLYSIMAERFKSEALVCACHKVIQYTNHPFEHRLVYMSILSQRYCSSTGGTCLMK